MSRVRVDEDIRPLSEFRAAVATFVKQLHENRRPVVLTQRGRGVAVLVDVHEYEKMQERLEILEEVYRAEEQISFRGWYSRLKKPPMRRANRQRARRSRRLAMCAGASTGHSSSIIPEDRPVFAAVRCGKICLSR